MPKDRVVLVMRYIVALATFSSQCMGVTSQFDASSISPSVTPSVSSLFASLSPTGLPTAAPSTSQPTVSLSPASAVPSTKVPTPTTPAPSGFLYNPTASDAPSAFNIGVIIDGALAPTTVTPPECWGNTTDIFSHLSQQAAYSHNTYVLCPHTVYDIGFNNNGLCCSNGDLPLVGRANTHYMCGTDGSSSNNCTLRSGTIQVAIDNMIFDENVTDITFEGITFEQAGSYVTLPSSSGNFTFKDCIFQVSCQHSIMITALKSGPARVSNSFLFRITRT